MHWGKLERDQRPRGPGANEAVARVQEPPGDPRSASSVAGFLAGEARIDWRRKHWDRWSVQEGRDRQG